MGSNTSSTHWANNVGPTASTASMESEISMTTRRESVFNMRRKRKRKVVRTTYCKILDPTIGRFDHKLSSPLDDSDVRPLMSVYDTGNKDELLEIDEDLGDVYFPYENIVLEGGGSQGDGYVGAMLELDRLGLLRKIKRFAGTSIGSVTATCLAVGHSPTVGLRLMDEGINFSDMLDAPLGKCCLIPNFMRSFGWNPGRKLYEYFGGLIAEKLDNPQATFKDLYDRTGNELCIVVTNLSVMMEEYCHVKTTPDLPIIAAIRMSVSAPGVFYPVQRRSMGRTDYYIDGGVLCNYPIHCFDGWWLSLKPEDSFLKRMQPLEDVTKLLAKSERFGGFNDKTFGLIVHCDYDNHPLPTNPELEAAPAPIPDTKLARAHQRMKRERELSLREHRLLTDAMSRFLKVLSENNLDDNDTIDINEFKMAVSNSKDFQPEHLRALFGDDLTADQIFRLLDANRDGQIDFHELMSLAEQEGVGIQTHQIGSGRLDINNAREFVIGILQLLLMNVKRVFTEGSDIERTVVINTVYIQSMDFNTVRADRDFMIEQGRRGIRAFLRYQKKRASAASSQT